MSIVRLALDRHSGKTKGYLMATDTQVLVVGAACLYVIRPHGYIGFRSQPPDAEALMSYFGRRFL